MRPVLVLMLSALAAGAAHAAQVPPDVAARVNAAMPGMAITDAELKERDDRSYYDVEGRLPDGAEIELDLLQTPAGWEVVEIQRDIPWTAVPVPARDAARPAWKGADPVRVIESRQTDGAVIYELFAPGRPETPALEVMVRDGKASVLKEVWPH
ncbi:hypothetical protein [Phenylobacterium sp.]|uniref:hypothetical protein n=1 Tax=Phenylobacterium sp. TaxID=1871053 RepID=UPI003919EE63